MPSRPVGRSALLLSTFRLVRRLSRRSSLYLLPARLASPACPASPTRLTSPTCPTSPTVLLRPSLPGLLLQHFTRIPDALLLIWIGFTEAADIGGHLADELSIDAGHRDMRLLFDRHVDAGWDVEHNSMRIPQGEDHLFPLHLRAVPDADDIELFLEAVGDARHGVGDQAARQAVKLREARLLRG